MKGHLSPWMFVECGAHGCKACIDLAGFGGRSAALDELRKRGWKHTAHSGFVCAECLSKGAKRD